jgi:hypothetical protein
MKKIKIGIMAFAASLFLAACTNTTENETATRNLQDQLTAKDQRINALEDSLKNCSSGATAATTPAVTTTENKVETTPAVAVSEPKTAMHKLPLRPASGRMYPRKVKTNTLDNNNQDGDVGRDIRSGVVTKYTGHTATANYYSGDRSVAPSKTGNNNGIRSEVPKDSIAPNNGLAPGK